MNYTDLHDAIDASDASGVSALLSAKHRPNLELADPVSGRTPLHQAVWRAAVHEDRGQHIIIGMLLKAQANPNAGDRYGLLPIVTAAGAGDMATLTLLLAYDADIYAQHPLSTQTAIQQCADFGNQAVMDMLNERAAFLAEAARETEARGTGARRALEFALAEPADSADEEEEAETTLAA